MKPIADAGNPGRLARADGVPGDGVVQQRAWSECYADAPSAAAVAIFSVLALVTSRKSRVASKIAVPSEPGAFERARR